MATNKQNHVLITGGGTYLGLNLASALLAEGIEVSLIIREGNEKRLGFLESRVRWSIADVWDSASLRGRARGHGTVIHTVGSMVADPSKGLTYNRLNVVSARNAASMCVTDGVQHFMLLSAVRAPWINREYLRSKREAEQHIRRLGLTTSIIRAPISYVRGADRPLIYQMMTVLGRIPPLNWTHIGRMAPMPLDVMVRGIARIAKDPPEKTRLYYANHLRRLNKRDELRGYTNPTNSAPELDDTAIPFDALDDNTPFGWSPPQNYDKDS
ncbi:MAG: NAD(P)H-binding protein [Phototrophicaceae bacterium]